VLPAERVTCRAPDATIARVKYVFLARTSLCAAAVAVSSCYWLAQYDDLSSKFGDEAGANADAQSTLEAGQSADAGVVPQSFCPPDAGPYAYCMEFDGVDAAVLDAQIFGADVAIVNGTYVSFPSSLSVSVNGNMSFGRYDVPFPFQPTTTRLEFQVQTPNLTEGVTTMAVALSQASTRTVRTLNVVMLPYAQFQVQEYFGFADGGAEINAHATRFADASVPDAWHHVVLTLTVDDMQLQYRSSLTLDDVIVEDGEQLALPWAQGTVSLHLGVTYAAAGGQQFFFDNVRADFTLP
jgi:hypothetical protein